MVILEVDTALHSSLPYTLTNKSMRSPFIPLPGIIFKVILLHGQSKDKEPKDSLLLYFANCF